jgi:hypothetical protein
MMALEVMFAKAEQYIKGETPNHTNYFKDGRLMGARACMYLQIKKRV